MAHRDFDGFVFDGAGVCVDVEIHKASICAFKVLFKHNIFRATTCHKKLATLLDCCHPGLDPGSIAARTELAIGHEPLDQPRRPASVAI